MKDFALRKLIQFTIALDELNHATEWVWVAIFGVLAMWSFIGLVMWVL